MRLILLILPLLLQYWDESPLAKSFQEHVAEITLSQYEGRAPGSEGEAAVAAYVWKAMNDRGVEMLCTSSGDIFGIAREGVDTLTSRNVMGYIQGYDRELRDHFIVVGARMDNLGVNQLNIDGVPTLQIYSGANGNASGLAMLIELAGSIAKSSILMKRSVIFVAFGGSTATFAGAWHFLHQSFAKDMDKIDAMVNLDMIGIDKDGLKVFTSGNSDLNMLLYELSSSYQPVRPTILTEEPYPSDSQVFYAGRIPSAFFTTGKYPEHNTAKDTQSILDYEFMERAHEYIYNFVQKLANVREGIPAFETKERTAPGKDEIVDWSMCDVAPSFLGVPDPSFFLQKWVYTYLKYPEACIRDGVQGRVMVEFVIDPEGNLKDAKVVRGIDEELDRAALKVVNASPKWKPGKIAGKKVSSKITIPVEFKLRKKK